MCGGNLCQLHPNLTLIHLQPVQRQRPDEEPEQQAGEHFPEHGGGPRLQGGEPG